MSAGSYMPGPVRAVEIPKDHGAGVRVLGVPSVADRIAQTAAARLLEEKLEPIFHPDSYGYRPGRSAHDALAVVRKRCWKQDWVLDLDIRAFFDSVPDDLLLKAVAHHTSLRWVLVYIERWLKARMQMPAGTLAAREKGTPQGSPISTLLANLFMHYAFDAWMDREYPGCPFERYADDIVAHCDSEAQALALRDSIARRLGALGLELHPVKTKVVYCKDTRRRGTSEHVSFDFLGYTFRGRVVRGQRGFFVGFNPAMSDKAARAVSQKIRAWHLNRRSSTDLTGLAEDINAQVRGWIGYYGAFYRSRLYPIALRIDQHLVRGAMQEDKRPRGRPQRFRGQARLTPDPGGFVPSATARSAVSGRQGDRIRSRTLQPLTSGAGHTRPRHNCRSGHPRRPASRPDWRNLVGYVCAQYQARSHSAALVNLHQL